MEPFSKQIQDAIRNSGLSQYALAKLAGISESAISRFMAGNSSMSLKTLNGVAYALGLKIEVGVSLINQPRKAGRPKAKEPKMATLKKLSKRVLSEAATFAAEDAHELNFSSRRGVYVLEDFGVVYYDNSPSAVPRENDQRELLIQEIRQFLKESKLRELSSAYWPVAGEEKDYTFAMIIEATADNLDFLRDGIQRLVNPYTPYPKTC